MRDIELMIAVIADVADEADNRGLHSQADELTSLMIALANTNELVKISYIKKTDEGYEVKSPDNPKWSGGTYSTKKKAKKRLRQVEYFKHLGKKKKK